jgi:3-hydroxyisobutyrate dehydrogenase-like beta-hydroxyacid dehydrogenase
MRAGFTGLGTMGASFAGNLLKGGHALTVHGQRRDAAAPWRRSSTPHSPPGACTRPMRR